MMNDKPKAIGFYNYTVVLTYVGMLCAFVAILMAIESRFWDSLIFLMISGLCDMFDGAIASTNKKRSEAEKRFGIQIDSLSDLVSFGVCPAIFVYMICDRHWMAGIIGGCFVLAALIRLAFYNVCEEDRQKTTTEKRSVFYGVPVTTIAVVLPVVYLLQAKFNKLHAMFPYLLVLILVGTGFLLPIEIKKPKLIGKICLIVIGILEALGVLFLGWDLV